MADDSNTINVINPAGKLVSFPKDAAQNALANGYRIATPQETSKYFEKQDYTTGLNPLKAGLEGALRGPTLGLSDQFLVHTGIVDPDVLKKRQDYNPAEAATGEGIGIGLSMLTGEGEAALAAGGVKSGVKAAGRALFAPIEGVSAVGRGIAEGLGGKAAVKATATKAAQEATLGILPGSSSVAGRVARSAAAHGAAGAVEGGLFGLGQAVSENAMGDPDALGEKLMSHVGFSAMIGGGLGSVVGGTVGLGKEGYKALKKAFPDAPTPTESLINGGVDPMPQFPKSELGDAMGVNELPVKEQEAFFKGKSKRADYADDVEAIGQKHGVPVLEEMLTNDEPLLKSAEALRDSPTPLGQSRVRKLNEGWDYWKDRFKKMFGDGSEQSEKELGEVISQDLSSKLSEDQAEFTHRFNERNNLQSNIPIGDEVRIKFRDKIDKMVEDSKWKVGDKPHTEAMEAVKTLLSRNTGDELAQGISLVREQADSLFRSGQGQAGHMVAEANKLAKQMLQEEILKEGTRLQGLGATGGREVAHDLYAEYEKLNKDFAAFAKERKAVLRNLNIGENTPPSKIKEILLERKNPQAIAKAIFNKNNVRSAEFFDKYAPDTMQKVKAYQRAKMATDAVKGGNYPLNPKTIAKDYEALPKELRNILFDKDEQMLLKEGSTYLHTRAYEKFNPSGTASMANYMGMGKLFNIFNTGDMGAAWAKLGKDAYTTQKLRAAGLKSEDLAHANWLANAIDKTNQRIQTGAKNIFKVADKNEGKLVGFAGSKVAEKLMSHDDHVATITQINELKNNPEKFIEKLDNSTKPIFKVAPGTSTAAHSATVRAVQYLAHAAPEIKSPYPLGETFPISKQEQWIFAERMHTVNNPETVLHEIKNGTLTPAHLEAVATVYPKLYQEMQQAVMTELTGAIAKKQQIPYQTKNMLSMFLGQDLDASITPQQVMANQVSLGKSQLTGKQQDQMMMGKTTQGGLGKLNMANNYKTDMQQSGQRVEKS